MTTINYKISDSKLKLKEYGRNIQMMVEYAKTLPNDDERNALIHEIVRIMSHINPSLRDNPDYMQKLWDHLYHLADYDIDVISDYNMPDHDTVHSRPEAPMKYQDEKSRFRSYGRNIDLMVGEALKIEDPAKQAYLVNMIVNIMRMHLMNTDRDSNAELTVLEHLRVISKGAFNLTPDQIRWYKAPPAPMHQPTSHSNRKNSKKSGGGQKKNQGHQKKYSKKNYNRK